MYLEPRPAVDGVGKVVDVDEPDEDADDHDGVAERVAKLLDLDLQHVNAGRPTLAPSSQKNGKQST